ncbi:MAG: spermidine synthase [Rhodospirillaceae bacterium]
MSVSFKEIDCRDTPIGVISLRQRRESALDVDVLEIKLDDTFLMSSLFTASEIALANLGLADLPSGGGDVVIGGLGLGYTAAAALDHPTVKSVIVIDALEAVIDWHRSGLLPLGAQLTTDKRCRFRQADFFELAASADGFDTEIVQRKFDAILVDIDHSPEFLLAQQNASFYTAEGLTKLLRHLRPEGVFGLWSNDLPSATFVTHLQDVFGSARAEEVTFPNPLQGNTFTQTIYIAKNAA